MMTTTDLNLPLAHLGHGSEELQGIWHVLLSPEHSGIVVFGVVGLATAVGWLRVRTRSLQREP